MDGRSPERLPLVSVPAATHSVVMERWRPLLDRKATAAAAGPSVSDGRPPLQSIPDGSLPFPSEAGSADLGRSPGRRRSSSAGSVVGCVAAAAAQTDDTGTPAGCPAGPSAGLPRPAADPAGMVTAQEMGRRANDGDLTVRIQAAARLLRVWAVLPANNHCLCFARPAAAAAAMTTARVTGRRPTLVDLTAGC